MALHVIAPHRGYNGPVQFGDVTLEFVKGIAPAGHIPEQGVAMLKANGFQFVDLLGGVK